MPSLQVRDLPQDIYRRLAEEAKRDHRSLSQEATVLLARALGAPPDMRERRQALLAMLSENPIVRDVKSIPAPEALVREDRDR